MENKMWKIPIVICLCSK